MIPASLLVAPLVLLTDPAAAPDKGAGQQEDVNERLDRLEAENAELRSQIGSLADEVERVDLGDVFPAIGDSVYGLGPAASKVYQVDQGISIGGYGETLFRFYNSDKTNEFDQLRTIIYIGYKFNDNWVVNTEIEFEHASTDAEGGASVEFATVDYLHNDPLNIRAGLVLIPMGFLNELHEPQTFLAATRPETESRIIPSTWRENGVGIFGGAGGFDYRAYVVNGLDGEGFSEKGLRGGRQRGSKAKAEDLAVVARLDWTDTPGVTVGGSVYMGNSGQANDDLGSTATSIYELHAEAQWRGVWARALGAWATVDDVARINAANGFGPANSVGEELAGAYVEVGYDLLSLMDAESRASVSPYVRLESVDTQAETPSGLTNPDNDFDVFTVGVNFKPIPQVVFKAEIQQFDPGDDSVNLSVGYAF